MGTYGWVLFQYDWYPYEKRRIGQTRGCSAEESPCGDTSGRPPASEQEKPQKKPVLPTP